MSDARDRRLEALLVVGILLTLAVVATYPLIRHLGNALPGDLGDPLLNAWTLGWDADRLRHGLRAFWHAPILYPARYTLAYSESLLGIGLFVAPVIWLTDNAVLAHNIAFLLSYVLAGAGMYFLARSLIGRRDAALIAAMIAAFSPLRASHLSHLQVLASGWMPIALWALHRYLATTSVRILAVFVAAFTLQAWSNAYFLYFLAIPVIAVVVHELAPRLASGSVPRRQVAQLAAAAAVILAAIASMIVAYVAVRRLYGFHRGYGDWRMFSADVQSYVSVSNNVRFWRDWLAGDQAPERQLF